jgi:hypothetical protein
MARRRGGPPGGIANQGRLYWSSQGTSRGKRAPIHWGVSGDFMQCVRHMRGKVRDPKGYCQERHIQATGFPAGRHGGGRGKRGSRIRR